MTHPNSTPIGCAPLLRYIKCADHYNPHDPSAVWVRDQDVGARIECAWMNHDGFDKPFATGRIVLNASQVTEQLGALDAATSGKVTNDLISQTLSVRNRFEGLQERQESA